MWNHCFGSCCYRTFVYLWIQGVTMPDVISIYFKFNSGDLASTSCQMCGSWNLPIFLLRDESLTLIDCFFDVSGNAVVLPAHYAEIVQGHITTCDVLMVFDGGWCSHVFPESFSKSSAWISNVLIFKIHPSTSVPLDHPTFLQYGILIFWVCQEISDGAASSEIYLHSMFPADVFAAFSYAFHVWNYNVGLVDVVAIVIVVVIVPFVLSLLVLVDVDSITGP